MAKKKIVIPEDAFVITSKVIKSWFEYFSERKVNAFSVVYLDAAVLPSHMRNKALLLVVNSVVPEFSPKPKKIPAVKGKLIVSNELAEEELILTRFTKLESDEKITVFEIK